jgi:hypothetical protein
MTGFERKYPITSAPKPTMQAKTINPRQKVRQIAAYD